MVFNMAEPIVAAQLYTLRDKMKTPQEIKAGLEKVRRMGYTAVQVSGIGKIDAEELGKICGGLGLKVCITHISLDDILNRTEQVAKNHRAFGCENVGIGSGPNVFTKGNGEDFYKKLAETLSEAGKKLKEYGLSFSYHNHNPEFTKFESGHTGMDILIDETDPDAVGFILDTYWVQAGGANPVDYIKRLKGRIKVIHFKDMAVSEDFKMQMAEIGNGNLNWAEIISACEETGIGYAAVEQDICRRDPFESLAISYNYLHDKFSLQ